jgi:hypothetical protein
MATFVAASPQSLPRAENGRNVGAPFKVAWLLRISKSALPTTMRLIRETALVGKKWMPRHHMQGKRWPDGGRDGNAVIRTIAI